MNFYWISDEFYWISFEILKESLKFYWIFYFLLIIKYSVLSVNYYLKTIYSLFFLYYWLIIIQLFFSFYLLCIIHLLLFIYYYLGELNFGTSIFVFWVFVFFGRRFVYDLLKLLLKRWVHGGLATIYIYMHIIYNIENII